MEAELPLHQGMDARRTADGGREDGLILERSLGSQIRPSHDNRAPHDGDGGQQEQQPRDCQRGETRRVEFHPRASVECLPQGVSEK